MPRDQEFERHIYDITQGKRKMPVELERECVRVVQNEESTERETERAMSELVRYHTVYLASIALDVFSTGNNSDATGLELRDMLQVATQQFMKKVKTFQLDLELRLTTHYSRDVRTTLIRELSKHGRLMIQGTPLMQQVSFKVHKLIDLRSKESERAVTLDEVMDEVLALTGHTEQFIKDAMHYTSVHYSSVNSEDVDIVASSDIHTSDIMELAMQGIQSKMQLSPDELVAITQFLMDLTPMPPALLRKLKGYQ